MIRPTPIVLARRTSKVSFVTAVSIVPQGEFDNAVSVEFIEQFDPCGVSNRV
jgi:hypothetical protein